VAFELLASMSMRPIDAAWTIPVIILAALFLSWAAESAQYRISQGLILAILALIQTLPEYSIEAVISWKAAHDPSGIRLMTANFTGALRLLIGLGWPLIFITATTANRLRTGRWLGAVELEIYHGAEVAALVPPCLYLLLIVIKGTLAWYDVVVPTALYGLYLYVMSLMPPEEESEDDMEPIARLILSFRNHASTGIIVALFLAGAALLFFFAEPFLESMIALAVSVGVSSYFMVQWVAPLLSEFPEKVSAFYWARKVRTAPMAVMNMTSSAINEATLLVALMPVVYSLGRGEWSTIQLDAHQRGEILMTLTAGLMGVVMLADRRFVWWEALVLFVFWIIGFAGPLFLGSRGHGSEWLHRSVSGAQIVWILADLMLMAVGVRHLAMKGLVAHLRAGRGAATDRNPPD
jgi:cation:H+ antiporter